jgi:UDP-glucose 4-epimerase
MAVCLVTGGAGFLGSHLVDALVADRHVVRVVDNFTTGRMENLAGVLDAIELYAGDCFETAFLGKVVRGVEWLFHLADGNDQTIPAGSETLRILSAAVEGRVRRVVFASSMHVYGRAGQRPVCEEDLTRPVCPYGQAKLSSEQACAFYTRASGLETVRLRYFNLFGPRQASADRSAGVVRDTLSAMRAGRTPVFAGDEQCAHDLLYVQDAVHATLLAARSPRIAGKVYNIGRGQATTWRELVDSVNELLGSGIEPIFLGQALPGGPHPLANVRRAEVELGFCAATDLRRGLYRCLEAHRRPTVAPCDRGRGYSATIPRRGPRSVYERGR